MPWRWVWSIAGRRPLKELRRILPVGINPAAAGDREILSAPIYSSAAWATCRKRQARLLWPHRDRVPVLPAGAVVVSAVGASLAEALAVEAGEPSNRVVGLSGHRVIGRRHIQYLPERFLN